MTKDAEQMRNGVWFDEELGVFLRALCDETHLWNEFCEDLTNPRWQYLPNSRTALMQGEANGPSAFDGDKYAKALRELRATVEKDAE